MFKPDTKSPAVAETKRRQTLGPLWAKYAPIFFISQPNVHPLQQHLFPRCSSRKLVSRPHTLELYLCLANAHEAIAVVIELPSGSADYTLISLGCPCWSGPVTHAKLPRFGFRRYLEDYPVREAVWVIYFSGLATTVSGGFPGCSRFLISGSSNLISKRGFYFFSNGPLSETSYCSGPFDFPK